MFYDGRFELALPPAPDTPGLRVARAAVAALGGFTVTIVVGLAWLGSLSDAVYNFYLLQALVAIPLWVTSAIICAVLHDRHETRYWTPDRVKQKCPALWQLYRASGPAVSHLPVAAPLRIGKAG